MAHAQKSDFGLSAKRTSPFKSAGDSVQSTTGSRGVRISGSNAGYTMFRGSVKSTGYPPFASFLFTSPPVRHRVPSHFNWTLPNTTMILGSCLPHNFASLLFIWYENWFLTLKEGHKLRMF